jgi:hypothetical protein
MTKSTIVVDSSQRITPNDPNNRFTLTLKRMYKNVTNIKLIGAIIPNTQYVINANNKSITINSSGTDYSFNLTEGNYTPTSLATELQTQLNTNVFGGVFTVTQSNVTNKMRLQCTVAVTYKFASNASLGRIFGFGSSDTSATADITSPNCFQVTTTKYYKVLIRDFAQDADTNLKDINFTFLIPNK